MISQDLENLQKQLHPLVGQKPWSVWLGMGSLVTLEFGKIIEQEGKRPTGEWRLWVYMSAWRLETKHKVLVASEDAREKISSEIRCLEGNTIRSIKLFTPSLETSIAFGKGITLKIFPIYSEHEEHWMLFTPNGNVLTIGPGSSWSYKNAASSSPISDQT